MDESASVVPEALTVMSRATLTTEPLVPIVALAPDEVSADEVARLIEMPPPTTERICATDTSVPSATTLTSFAPARSPAAPITRTLPSNAASVRPSASAFGLLLPTATSPAETASAKARAALLAVARTTTFASGVPMSALVPITARVSAPEVTSASGEASAPAPRPAETSAEVATATFAPIASTVIREARVRSPSRLAVVALRALATGRDNPIEIRPPVPASESAKARLFDVARTPSAPSMSNEADAPAPAVTSAPVSTVALVREPA